MESPAKFTLSARYSEYEICGALELLDQGFSGEPGMAQTCATGGKDLGAGRGRERGLRDDESSIF